MSCNFYYRFYGVTLTVLYLFTPKLSTFSEKQITAQNRNRSIRKSLELDVFFCFQLDLPKDHPFFTIACLAEFNCMFRFS